MRAPISSSPSLSSSSPSSTSSVHQHRQCHHHHHHIIKTIDHDHWWYLPSKYKTPANLTRPQMKALHSVRTFTKLSPQSSSSSCFFLGIADWFVITPRSEIAEKSIRPLICHVPELHCGHFSEQCNVINGMVWYGMQYFICNVLYGIVWFAMLYMVWYIWYGME